METLHYFHPNNDLRNALDKVELDDSASCSEDTVDSEIERIQSNSPHAALHTNDSPGETGIAKSNKQEDIILRTIETAKALGSNTLDLSNKGMLLLPEQVLQMPNLEYLYLEGNELSSLPDDFFDKLPNLIWLDLRRNCLLRLPSVYTGRHQHLRTLLLEGNRLRSLPLEFGLIRSLNGLNISNNPLEFPPADVIGKGTNHILQFLREMLHAKSTGKLLNGSSNGAQAGDIGAESSTSSDEWEDDDSNLQNYARKMHRAKIEDTKSTTTKSSDMFGPVHHTAELHRPVSYTEIKQEKKDKIQKAGAAGTVERRSSANNSVLSWKVNPYPEPPPSEYVTFKMNEERKMAKTRELREKTDAIIQRRKDEEVLKEWRHDAKKLQQKKYFESVTKGTKDFVDPVHTAPYDVDKNHIKMPTNEERIKQDVKNAHERIRRTLSPASRQKIEEEKHARIRELERRIKQHTALMHERRKQPKGTPQEEMHAAKKELEIAEDLHKELQLSRKNIEYRFKAFTADISGTRKTNVPRS